MFNSLNSFYRSKPKILKEINSTLSIAANKGVVYKVQNGHGQRKGQRRPGKKSTAPASLLAQERAICLEGCRYDVVRRMALEMNFKEVGEHDVWNIIWTDTPISLEKALEMRRFQDAHSIFWGSHSPLQKANHFPGMNEICRKDRLARNLNRMKRSFPNEYSFFPKTWSLPADVADLMMHARLRKNSTYICKPDSGCQGRGIFLIRNMKKINPYAKVICQVYIPKPLLVDGYKFDLRMYILITSCDPLRIYVYNEGIARFATVKYAPPTDQNVDIVFMHLTNYSLNKFSQSYMPEGEGSKRKLSTVYDLLLTRGYNVPKIIEDIDELVVKTMIAAQPTLRHYYRASFPKHDRGCACFEVLGFDILIDETMKPWLLEVNHSPSFNLDLPIDAEVKESLLRDTFNKIHLGSVNEKDVKQMGKNLANLGHMTAADKAGNPLSKALQIQFHHESLHQGNYRLIYPAENCQKYTELFQQTCTDLHQFATISSRRRGDGRGVDDGEKYDFVPSPPDEYIVTKSIDKNGTVCTTKKSRNQSFLKMEFGPTKDEDVGQISNGNGRPSFLLADNSLLQDRATQRQSLLNFERINNNFSQAEGLRNPLHQQPSLAAGGDGEMDSLDSDQATKRPIRRNFAKEALEMAQERANLLRNAQHMSEQRRPCVNYSSGRHSSTEGESLMRLRLPLPPKVSQIQLKKPDSNFKIFVNQQDEVSVFRFPATEQDLAPSPSPNPVKSHHRPPSPPIEYEGEGSTEDLDRYFAFKPKKETKVMLDPRNVFRKVNPKSHTVIKRNMDRSRVHSLHQSVDKHKLIEDWIKDGARERTKGIRKSQYASDIVDNRERMRRQLLPKIGSGVHLNEEAQQRQPAEYFQPPKAHRRAQGTNLSRVLRQTIEQEETERKIQLQNRERAVKELGVEAQAFQVVRRTGKMKLGDEYVYNKIFPDDDYSSYPSHASHGSSSISATDRDPLLRKSPIPDTLHPTKYNPFSEKYQPFFKRDLFINDSDHRIS